MAIRQFRLFTDSYYLASTPGAAPYKTKPSQKCEGFVVSGLIQPSRSPVNPSPNRQTAIGGRLPAEA